MTFSGYFRAPVMVSLSRRPDPNTGEGRSTELVYAPNRLVDANYNSFSYTRLQEGDWGEVYLGVKRPHVQATLAFMGYWYAWGGYEYPNASWAPAQAWVTLDSDFRIGKLKPHVELRGGVFWQRWGMFDQYDTYLFGRFHQAGEAVTVELPLASELRVRVIHGLGANRNGSPSTATGLTLLHYAHIGVEYRDLVRFGLYYDDSFTRDPSLFSGSTPSGSGSYSAAQRADMTVAGADVVFDAPRAGHFWVAGGLIHVQNGWALSQTVEILHSPGGVGVANNYLAYGEPGSTGSGSILDLAGLYQNTLRGITREPAERLPNLKFSLFALLANTTRDLDRSSTVSRHLRQLKWGTDLTLISLPWLAFTLRYDAVNLDRSAPGRAFSVLTPRVTFASHLLATDSIWVQYSRYFYGSRVTLPTSPAQPYSTPDRDVIKVQANVTF